MTDSSRSNTWRNHYEWEAYQSYNEAKLLTSLSHVLTVLQWLYCNVKQVPTTLCCGCKLGIWKPCTFPTGVHFLACKSWTINTNTLFIGNVTQPSAWLCLQLQLEQSQTAPVVSACFFHSHSHSVILLSLYCLSSPLSVFSRCFGEDTCITIPDIDAVVMVLQPSEPRITITGVERLNRPASDLRAPEGVALFQDLHIVSTVTRADATTHHTGTR